MSARPAKNKNLPARRPSSDAIAPDDLREPIASLRQLMRRAMEMSEAGDKFQELVDFMEKYSLASTRMASLLKAQRILAEEQGVGKALQQAMAEVLAEMEARERKEGIDG